MASKQHENNNIKPTSGKKTLESANSSKISDRTKFEKQKSPKTSEFIETRHFPETKISSPLIYSKPNKSLFKKIIHKDEVQKAISPKTNKNIFHDIKKTPIFKTLEKPQIYVDFEIKDELSENFLKQIDEKIDNDFSINLISAKPSIKISIIDSEKKSNLDSPILVSKQFPEKKRTNSLINLEEIIEEKSQEIDHSRMTTKIKKTTDYKKTTEEKNNIIKNSISSFKFDQNSSFFIDLIPKLSDLPGNNSLLKSQPMDIGQLDTPKKNYYFDKSKEEFFVPISTIKSFKTDQKNGLNLETSENKINSIKKSSNNQNEKKENDDYRQNPEIMFTNYLKSEGKTENDKNLKINSYFPISSKTMIPKTTIFENSEKQAKNDNLQKKDSSKFSKRHKMDFNFCKISAQTENESSLDKNSFNKSKDRQSPYQSKNGSVINIIHNNNYYVNINNLPRNYDRNKKSASPNSKTNKQSKNKPIIQINDRNYGSLKNQNENLNSLNLQKNSVNIYRERISQNLQVFDNKSFSPVSNNVYFKRVQSGNKFVGLETINSPINKHQINKEKSPKSIKNKHYLNQSSQFTHFEASRKKIKLESKKGLSSVLSFELKKNISYDILGRTKNHEANSFDKSILKQSFGQNIKKFLVSPTKLETKSIKNKNLETFSQPTEVLNFFQQMKESLNIYSSPKKHKSKSRKIMHLNTSTSHNVNNIPFQESELLNKQFTSLIQNNSQINQVESLIENNVMKKESLNSNHFDNKFKTYLSSSPKKVEANFTRKVLEIGEKMPKSKKSEVKKQVLKFSERQEKKSSQIVKEIIRINQGFLKKVKKNI